jgi:hypothetical protein
MWLDIWHSGVASCSTVLQLQYSTEDRILYTGIVAAGVEIMRQIGEFVAISIWLVDMG